MTKEEFIGGSKVVEQKVSADFADAVLGAQYVRVAEAFCEMIDNSIDNRRGNHTEIQILKDTVNHTLTVLDFGKGITNIDNMWDYGASEKREEGKGAIGKFGIGLKAAVASIFRKCAINYGDNMYLSVRTITNDNGIRRGYTQNVGFFFNKTSCMYEMIVLEKIEFTPSDNEPFQTSFTFNNVDFDKYSTKESTIWGDILATVLKVYKETYLSYKESIGFDLSAFVNGEKVDMGWNSFEKTFKDEDKKETIFVNGWMCAIRSSFFYRSELKDGKRVSDDSSLRIYDGETGRLIAEDRTYWKYFTGLTPHTDLNGSHTGIFINRDYQCYRDFGVRPSKNGINYGKYYTHKGFEDLYSSLLTIAREAKENNEAQDKLEKKSSTPMSKVYHFPDIKSKAKNKAEALYSVYPITDSNIDAHRLDRPYAEKINRSGVFFVQGKKVFVAEDYIDDIRIRDLISDFVNGVKSYRKA